jgi:hypothetical protein
MLTRTAIDPRQYYLNLCDEVTDELCLAMLHYMIENAYIGFEHRVTRGELAEALLGKDNPRNDRKIRKAKETLTKQGFPILSSSGTAGYYLAEYQDEIDGFIQENNNRIASLQEQNRAARKIKLPYLQPKHVQQRQLFGGR